MIQSYDFLCYKNVNPITMASFIKEGDLLNNNFSTKIISNSIVYTISGLIQKCFSFFLLPLYTAYLTPSDYGLTGISSTFINTMGFIVAFSLFSSILRFFVDFKSNPDKLKRFYGTIIIFTFLSGIVFGLLLFLLRGTLSSAVFGGVDFFPFILIVLISLVFSCQVHIYENILRSQQKAFKYAVLSLAYFFVTVICNLFFVVYLKKGAIGVVLATMIANLLYTLYFIADLLKMRAISFCIDIPLLKEALSYSIPIMPHNLSTQIAQFISMALIGGTRTIASLGLYSVALQFGNMADIIQVYINNAYGPWLYEKLHAKDDGYKNNIASAVSALCVIIGLFFLCLSLFAHDYIVLFVKQSYCSSWKYIPLIVGTYAIKTPYYFYINILFYHKKASKFMFVATLSSSLINIFLSAFFIPLYGVYGSIVADAISMIIRVGIIVIISKRFESIGIKLMSFVGNFFVVISFILIGLFPSYLFYSSSFSFVNLFYKFFIIVLYISVFAIKYRKTLRYYVQTIKGRFSGGKI